MNKHHIQAIGHFLSSYENDLRYISKFQDYKKGKLKPSKYIKKEDSSFYKFLIEFKVIRSIPKGTTIALLRKTKEWIATKQSNDVDLFAQTLKTEGITRNDSRSLASKILFLNNPVKIIPMDTLTRKALSVRQNNYSIYRDKLHSFKTENKKILQDMMLQVEPLFSQIHKKYPTINNLDTIAQNRMVDKLLWTVRG